MQCFDLVRAIGQDLDDGVLADVNLSRSASRVRLAVPREDRRKTLAEWPEASSTACAATLAWIPAGWPIVTSVRIMLTR